MSKGKLYNAIIGAIIGDIMGVPFEFQRRNEFKCTDMTDGGIWNQPLGSWSDDSSMILAFMDSVIENKGINYTDIFSRWDDWYNNNEYTAYNNTFDCGRTCGEAISRFMMGVNPLYCGGTNYNDNGNGALMRIIPVAFMNLLDDEINLISGLTHNHRISKECCLSYIHTVRNFLNENYIYEYNKNMRDVSTLKEKDIKSGGYVVETIEAAYWCVMNSNSYEEAILKAVNLGGDTDTTACVTGPLAALKFNDIPKKWINNIPKLSWIETIIKEFGEAVNYEE